MRQMILALAVFTCLVSCEKERGDLSGSFKKQTDSLQRMLEKYTEKGIPGAVIMIKTPKGSWAGSSGYSNIETRIPMKTNMLHYGCSITKMVTAVAVMQLKEKGLIQLDKPIKDYLPRDIHTMVPNTDLVTVRMLLNHSSGYADYIRTDAFSEIWLNNPLKVWTRAEYYQLMREHVAGLFSPGSDYHYSNTNYYLLSIIIDKVTGNPHGQYYQENIFNKLSLTQTYYKHSPKYPLYENMPESYWPRLQDGVLENITAAQKAWMKGEEYGANGLIASGTDLIKLLEGLVNGKLVGTATLNEMKQWIQGSGSGEPDYGLGLCYWGYKGKQQWGHDGDGIGGMVELIYFPASRTYVFAAANASAEFGGEIAEQLINFRNETGEFLSGFEE